MKKIALTSLLALVAATGAQAANVINGNPLYRPGENRFYSITSLNTSTNSADVFALNEEFGYGITDRWSVGVGLNANEKGAFASTALNNISVNGTYRFLDAKNWKADAMAEYAIGGIWYSDHGLLEKDSTYYVWTAGVRGGYVTDFMTIAGYVNYSYFNTETFNWDNEINVIASWDADQIYAPNHLLTLGAEAQWILGKCCNLVAGAEYNATLGRGAWERNLGNWKLSLGLNYNIDETKFIGAYINKYISNESDATADSYWTVQDGFGMGVKFGIDF